MNHRFLLIFSSLLFVFHLLPAQEVNFYEGSWADAQAKAQKENKFILLDAYTDWCYWCKVMDKKTFKDPAVAQFVNKHFVPVKINFEEGQGLDMAIKFRVRGFPTLLFFNPAGQLVRKSAGYNPDMMAFLEMLREVLETEEAQPFAFDARKLDVDWPEFLHGVYAPNGKKSFPKKEEVVKFLEGREDLFDEVSWTVMQTGLIDDNMREHFLDHYDKYKEMYGRADVEMLLQSLIHTATQEAIEEDNEDQFNMALDMCSRLEEYGVQSQISIRAQRAKAQGDLYAYAEQIDQLAERFAETNYNALNTHAWEVYEQHEEPWLIRRAIGWIDAACATKKNDYAMLDTYAALLYKAGDYKAAEKKALEAIAAGKVNEEDYSGTEKLLEKIRAAGEEK